MTFKSQNLDPYDVLYSFQTLDRRKMVPGEKAYAISCAWLRNFKQQIGFYSEPQDSEITCGPIDNNFLLKKGKFDHENMRENYNFGIITWQMWEQLKEWFGGGPEISFPIVDSATGPRAILNPLQLRFHYKNMEKNITTHKYINVSDLKQQVSDAFGLPADKESRIVDYWNGSCHDILKDDESLEKYQIYNDQDMLLDTKNEDGTWDMDNAKNNEIGNNSLSRTNPVEYYGAPNSGNYDSYRNNNNSTTTTTNTASSTFNNNNNSYSNNNNINSFNNRSGMMPLSDSGFNNRSTSEKAIGPGIVGLTDLGNTCFFNSGVQCLMHTVPLMQVFLNSDWRRDLNKSNPIGKSGSLAEAFARLAQRFWSGDEKFISPTDLKFVIGQFASQFSGCEQQDAHELITFMLDGIHEDLNRVIQKPTVQSINGDGDNDNFVSEASWESFKSRNDSVIVDNFYGQYRSRLKCPECDTITVVFDPFVALTLPISRNKRMKACFVPKDFLQKTVKVSILLSKDDLYDDYRRHILSKIDRPDLTIENLVICDWHYGVAAWGTKNESFGMPDLYAFEIDDPSKYYAATCLKMGFVDQFTPHLEIGPFILPFDTDSPSSQDINESAEKVFSSFWNARDDIEIPESVKAYKETLRGDDASSYSSFKIELGYTGSYPNTQLRFDKTDPLFSHFSKISPVLHLNQSRMTKSSNFSLNPFLSKVKPPASSRMKGYKLSRCFQLFAMSDRLDDGNKWYCPKCQRFVCADKKMDIWKVPNCLIIQLKRFSSSSEYSHSKDSSAIEYPLSLDLREYIVGPQKDDPNLTYNLYGVSEHMGGLAGGHYTAHAKVVQIQEDGSSGNEDGKWYSFDNEKANESSEEAAINPDAYLLFYQRANSANK